VAAIAPIERMREPCRGWEGSRLCTEVYGERVAVRISNGKLIIRHSCVCCGWLSSYNLPGTQAEAARLTLAADWTDSVPPCERCGKAGSERHHWAPRSLFEDADKWPTSYLCGRHHRQWH
jgi:hypothetical protein